MRNLDPRELSRRDLYFLMIGAIVPRPIALVSTVSGDGVANLAPISFFNGVSADPPVVSLSIASRRGEKKDTLRNVEETGELVVNVVDEAMAEKMNIASGDFPPGISEFDEAGLTPLPSVSVRPSRVNESPVHLECRVREMIRIGGGDGDAGTTLILSDVLRFHVGEDILLADCHLDQQKLNAIGKMGGMDYCRTGDRFDLKRPGA